MEPRDLNTVKEIVNDLTSFIDSETILLSAEKLEEIENIETSLYNFIRKFEKNNAY